MVTNLRLDSGRRRVVRAAGSRPVLLAADKVAMGQGGWDQRRFVSWVVRAVVLGGLLLVVGALSASSPLGIALPLAIEVVTAVVVIVSVARKPALSRVAWWCIAGSVALRVAGDLIYDWQQFGQGQDPFPGWADPVYLASYLPLVAAMVLLIACRLPNVIPEELLDTALITISIATLTCVFVIKPGISGQPFSPVSILATTYPVLDVVVLSALVRLSVGGGHRNRSLGLLTAALSALLVADLLYAVLATAGQVENLTGGLNALYAMGVLLMAAATLSSDAATITQPERAVDDRPIPTGRIIALVVAAVSLPATAILRIGVGDDLEYQILAAGTAAVILMIGWRALRLMRVVNQQRRELDETARTDALTGLPNRRSWDFEVQRWDAWATRTGHPLTIAVMDLDRFKDYNDQHGHLAGDRLLRDCAQAWRAALAPEGYLARYGGEEFAVILPNVAMVDARPALEELRLATPEVTVSIGYAGNRAGAMLIEILGAADAALYAAKTAGRDRVTGIAVKVPAPTVPTAASLPASAGSDRSTSGHTGGLPCATLPLASQVQL